MRHEVWLGIGSLALLWRSHSSGWRRPHLQISTPGARSSRAGANACRAIACRAQEARLRAISAGSGCCGRQKSCAPRCLEPCETSGRRVAYGGGCQRTRRLPSVTPHAVGAPRRRAGARKSLSATENAPFFSRPVPGKGRHAPTLLIDALQIAPGAAVADVGSGTGLSITWRLAEQVGARGKVYAVDVQQSMLDLTKAAVAERKLSNVEYVLADDDNPRLPARPRWTSFSSCTPFMNSATRHP